MAKAIEGQDKFPDWPFAEKNEVFRSVFSLLTDFNKDMTVNPAIGNLRGLRQYLGYGVASLHSTGYMSDSDVNGQLNISPSYTKNNFNITAACIDTLSAKLASIEAVPQAVTCKGNSKGRKLAENLNFLLKGLFHKFDLTHLINMAFRDAMINKGGYLKVCRDDKEGVTVDRLMADEIVVDPADGYYGKPYKITHRKSVPVKVMLKLYPEFEKDILACQIQEVRQIATRNFTPCITVAESWCLNTYIEKGRHSICVETADLVDEDWDEDFFPILKCDYSEPPIGWLGPSVVEELLPIQQEIDRILFAMQAIMKIISVPRVFVDSNAQVNKNHMTNKIGIIVEYDGKQGVAPIIHNGAGMPPELPMQLENLINLAYARIGLTPMDTQGQQKTGSGNQSGEALKTMTDIKSERWRLLQHNYEQKHVELANIILRMLKGTSIKVSALDRAIGLREISTKVIPNTHTSYVLKIFPVSSLPDSIPDLIDSVQQMLQLGVIQPSQVPELFKMPDLDAYTTMQSAPMKLVNEKLEEMLDTGKYFQPEPYHDLQYALSSALQHYSWAQLNNESEKKLQLLRKFIEEVKYLLSQVPPAPQPQVKGAQK